MEQLTYNVQEKGIRGELIKRKNEKWLSITKCKKHPKNPLLGTKEVHWDTTTKELEI